jgi:hypothetical protein
VRAGPRVQAVRRRGGALKARESQNRKARKRRAVAREIHQGRRGEVLPFVETALQSRVWLASYRQRGWSIASATVGDRRPESRTGRREKGWEGESRSTGVEPRGRATAMNGLMMAARPPFAALLLVMSVAGCGAVGTPGGSVGDRPGNPKAVAPIALVAQGSGPAGDYRVWAFHTSDGMSCIEVDSINAEGGGCDPTGGPPLGGGLNRNAHGVVVSAFTATASAAKAVIHDASGASMAVALVDVDPTLPGVKVAVANLGPAANPVAVDFLDAGGSKVDSVPFP